MCRGLRTMSVSSGTGDGSTDSTLGTITSPRPPGVQDHSGVGTRTTKGISPITPRRGDFCVSPSTTTRPGSTTPFLTGVSITPLPDFSLTLQRLWGTPGSLHHSLTSDRNPRVLRELSRVESSPRVGTLNLSLVLF